MLPAGLPKDQAQPEPHAQTQVGLAQLLTHSLASHSHSHTHIHTQAMLQPLATRWDQQSCKETQTERKNWTEPDPKAEKKKTGGRAQQKSRKQGSAGVSLMGHNSRAADEEVKAKGSAAGTKPVLLPVLIGVGP